MKIENYKLKIDSGVTLIEVVIYIALVSFILSGILISVYQILSRTDNLASRNNTEQDANFIIAKIGWALDGVASVSMPTPNTSGASLSVVKDGYSSGSFSFTLSGDDIFLQRGVYGPVVLNSDQVVVSSLSFDFTRQIGLTTVDSITTSFYVNGKRFEFFKVIR